jgi:hypothetical protein
MDIGLGAEGRFDLHEIESLLSPLRETRDESKATWKLLPGCYAGGDDSVAPDPDDRLLPGE